MVYVYIKWDNIQPLKKKILTFAVTQINLILNEISQTKKERQILHDTTYMWNLKFLLKKPTSYKQSRMVMSRSFGEGEMGRWRSKDTNFQL